MKILYSFFIISFLNMSCAETAKKRNIPPGWLCDGRHIDNYQFYLVKDANSAFNNCLFISSNKATNNDFCTIGQSLSAKEYKNSRICLTGFIKTNNTAGKAALWMSIYDKSGVIVGFDNMITGIRPRAVSSTHDWKEYAIVLNVPEKAELIAFGGLLQNNGEAYFDKFKISKVDSTYTITGFSKSYLGDSASIKGIKPTNKLYPLNMDFEEGATK